MISSLTKNLSGFARQVAPLITAGAAFSTGGQASTLSRLAAGANVLGGFQNASLQTQPRSEAGQSVAISITDQPARETAMSGELGIAGGGIVPAAYRGPIPSGGMRTGVERASLPVVAAGRGLIQGGRGVMNMLGLAGGAITVAPIIIDPLTGEEKKLRVTRRLRSQVKQAVEMFGIEFVAEQMGTDVEVIVYILTKKMRNDGPYVTKAAVRKTRQTVRKMKTLCDMYDDLRPAARRRAPARKTMSTRITNVK